MPELPEVETVKNTLKPQLVGQKIQKVQVYHDKMIKGVSVSDFMNSLVGQEFIDISRRGKYLIFITTDYYLLSHLRMEGKFFYGEETAARDKHVHALFQLDGGEKLRYEDVRKFGTFHLYGKSTDLELTPSFVVLGPEPFEPEFNAQRVKQMLKGKSMPIKSMLLSQKVVTGLGNIYVDEVLYASKVHPLKPSGKLKNNEIEAIVEHTRDILSRAIELKGTTIKTFTSSHGQGGGFQDFLQVHTRVGEPCKDCETVIEKIKVGGRGTYFCKKCQPVPRIRKKG